MLSNPYLLFGFLALVCVGALFALVKLARMYNSPDGERLQRKRMQGPFVPLSAEEISEDEQRSKQRRA